MIFINSLFKKTFNFVSTNIPIFIYLYCIISLNIFIILKNEILFLKKDISTIKVSLEILTKKLEIISHDEPIVVLTAVPDSSSDSIFYIKVFFGVLLISAFVLLLYSSRTDGGFSSAGSSEVCMDDKNSLAGICDSTVYCSEKVLTNLEQGNTLDTLSIVSIVKGTPFNLDQSRVPGMKILASTDDSLYPKVSLYDFDNSDIVTCSQKLSEQLAILLNNTY
jgi:hypothetical protein